MIIEILRSLRLIRKSVIIYKYFYILKVKFKVNVEYNNFN